MTTRSDTARPPPGPAAWAGLGVLVVGLAVLVAGPGVFGLDPRTDALWMLGLGGVVLAGGLAVEVARIPRKRDSASSPPERAGAFARPDPEDASIPPGGSYSAVRPIDAGPVAAPVSTSIPGAYLAAVDSLSPPDRPTTGVEPPPIAALPFLALARPLDLPGSLGDAPETSAVLDVELVRLRARLEQLEADATRETARLTVSGARSGPVPSLSAASPISRWVLPPFRALTDCPRCGGRFTAEGARAACPECGRPLCTSCATGDPTDARCAGCSSARPGGVSTAISGGRSGPSSGAWASKGT